MFQGRQMLCLAMCLRLKSESIRLDRVQELLMITYLERKIKIVEKVLSRELKANVALPGRARNKSTL